MSSVVKVSNVLTKRLVKSLSKVQFCQNFSLVRNNFFDRSQFEFFVVTYFFVKKIFVRDFVVISLITVTTVTSVPTINTVTTDTSVCTNAQCTTVACYAQYSCTTMHNKHAQC